MWVLDKQLIWIRSILKNTRGDIYFRTHSDKLVCRQTFKREAALIQVRKWALDSTLLGALLRFPRPSSPTACVDTICSGLRGTCQKINLDLYQGLGWGCWRSDISSIWFCVTGSVGSNKLTFVSIFFPMAPPDSRPPLLRIRSNSEPLHLIKYIVVWV